MNLHELLALVADEAKAKAQDGYVRDILHTNFAESYHSLLKRGIMGAFRQHSLTFF
jgi:hypothetical protein